MSCRSRPDRSIREDRGTRMAIISFDGIHKEICLAYLPDIDVGDYTIVHVGFAISKIDEASALETLQMFKELGILDEELGMNDAADDAAVAQQETSS